MPKKILLWALVAFLVFYLVTQPGHSASIVRGIAGGIGGIAHGLASFLGGLA